MSFKQLAIIIDDFSQHSATQYDNVWFYDYGRIETGWVWDFYLNDDFSVSGYGNINHIDVNHVTPNGFYRVDYQDDTA